MPAVPNINMKNNEKLSKIDDITFIKNAYREILHREVDECGLDGGMYRLQNGGSRSSFLKSLVVSEEFQNNLLLSSPQPNELPNLVALSPHKYTRRDEFLTFKAYSPSDYDWLEKQIIINQYYEHTGNWGYELDFDKRLMAKIVSLFSPNKVLELGCGVGAILRGLMDIGIDCIGLDVSKYSKDHAIDGVSNKILLGDLLDTEIQFADLDTICGFDVFEHLNPNKINDYFNKCAQLLPDGGILFLNVPAFGNDDVFGYVHHYWIDDWLKTKETHDLFQLIPCDDRGFPLMGHLIWADSIWWEQKMSKHGFFRLRDCELLLHKKFDDLMDYSSARRSYFLMMKGRKHEKSLTIQNKIANINLNDLY